MSDLIGLEFRFPDLGARLAARHDEIMLFAAAVIQTNRALMFDTNNAGRTPWAPPKLRNGQPLTISKALRNSFAPHNSGDRPILGQDGIVEIVGDTIKIGTKIAYAKTLNDGAVILPKNYPVLWIPLPDGAAKSANAPSKLTKDMKKAAANRKAMPKMHEKMAKLQAKYKKDPSPENRDNLIDHRDKIAKAAGQTAGPPIVKGRNGKYYLLAKKATIPARPMDEWVASDQQELEEALKNKLEKVFQEIING